ncbi:MAG: class I tRNA ligase family protein, partial [Rhizobiales bacterium]|nr:class I tRNA ligase family protein [Hyphomicrobiales bacterium]
MAKKAKSRTKKARRGRNAASVKRKKKTAILARKKKNAASKKKATSRKTAPKKTKKKVASKKVASKKRVASKKKAASKKKVVSKESTARKPAAPREHPTKPRYYLTTAIAYPNGAPHIGFAYELIATDAIARFKRLDGYDVFFLTGTDEHGIKMLQTATKEGITPRQLLDRTVPRFRELLVR